MDAEDAKSRLHFFLFGPPQSPMSVMRLQAH